MSPRKAGGPGIGRRLKDLRLQLGWSQETLAERSGLRRTEISVIERGRNKGTSFRVRTWLARAFGIQIETLDAYWAGKLPAAELIAAIHAAAASRTDRPADDAEQWNLRDRGTAASRTPTWTAKLPNLGVAVELVARDSELARDALHAAAEQLARAQGRTETDHEVLQWVRELESTLGLSSAPSTPDVRSVPNLVLAVRLIAEDRSLDEDTVTAAAAARLATQRAPADITTIQWIKLLEADLTQTASGRRRGRGRRSPSKRRRS